MPEFLQYDFMQRAFIAGIVISIIAPFIGNFLVVRRYSLMADTLAHVSLAGVAIGLLLQVNILLAAVVTTAIAAIGMEALRHGKKIFGESVLAIFLTGSLALGAVLLSLSGGQNINLFSFLFGSISTVQVVDLYYIIGIGIIVMLFLIIFYKEFFAISLNEETAKASGIRVQMLNFILVVLAAITVAIAMRIVGILLIGALVVIPVVSAIQFEQGFHRTIYISIFISLLSVISGLIASFYLGLPSGGVIVLVSLFVFIMSLLVNKISK